MDDLQQFCTFHVGRYLFGVEVERVQEILRYQQMTRVPLAPRSVTGLINLRGEIVPAIDLRSRLDMPPREQGSEPTNVVLRTEDGAVSLLVDEIGDVLEVGESAFEPPPDTLRGAARVLVRGVYKLPDRLLLILAAEASIDVTSENADPGQGRERPL